jgi:hypothetical protein
MLIRYRKKYQNIGLRMYWNTVLYVYLLHTFPSGATMLYRKQGKVLEQESLEGKINSVKIPLAQILAKNENYNVFKKKV